MTTSLKVPSKISADPKAVRTWLEANGLIPTGQRGRFSQAQREAYNKSHKGFGAYREAEFDRSAVATLGKGKKARKINAVAARSLLVANGLSVPVRGRLSAAQIAAAVALDNGAPVDEVAATLTRRESEASVLRSALVAAGHEVGSRGRLSAEQIETARNLLTA